MKRRRVASAEFEPGPHAPKPGPLTILEKNCFCAKYQELCQGQIIHGIRLPSNLRLFYAI